MKKIVKLVKRKLEQIKGRFKLIKLKLKGNKYKCESRVKYKGYKGNSKPSINMQVQAFCRPYFTGLLYI